MTLVEYIMGSIAGAALILGIFNSWWIHSKAKVKLRVSIRRAITDGELVGLPPKCMCISVINLSAFPVIAAEFGIIKQTGSKLDLTLTLPKRFPVRLESRENFDVYVNDATWDFEVKRAYVRTACGLTVTGKEERLENIRGDVIKEDKTEYGSDISNQVQKPDRKSAHVH